MKRVKLHKPHINARLVIACAVMLLAIVGAVVTQKPQVTRAAAASTASSANPCVSAPAPAAWHHVIVLMFENKTYSQVINNSLAPYTSSLATKCATATNWKDGNYKVDGKTSDGSYKSKPNYFVMAAGVPASTTAIGPGQDDYTTQASVDSIWRAVRDKGLTAKSYVEGITSNATPCDVTASTATSGSYHDSHRFFNGTGDKAYCNSHDVDLSKFTTDLNNGTLPEFSMVFPKNTSNMHDNTVDSGDTWAKNFLNPIFDSATYKSGDTAVFFLWDEDTPIPNVMAAPSVGPTKITNASHYDALKTWEEMLGTRMVGDSAQATSMLTSVFGGGSACTTGCTSGDTTPPNVSITSPSNGSSTSATSVTVNANATDNVAVKQVEFFVNNTSKQVDTASPYTFNWSTSGLASGAYTIKAVATDTAGNTSQNSITVNYVAPSSCSVSLPATSLGSASYTTSIPSNGTYNVWSRVKAPDTNNNSYILQIDNDCPVLVGDSAAMPTGSWQWVNYQNGNTGSAINMTLTSGSHTVKMIGREANVALDRVLFLSDTCVPTSTGDNCTAVTPPAPTVSLSGISAGQTISGTQPLSATATAGSGTTIANVEFFYGLTSISKDTSSPYSGSWDTTTVPNGTYTVCAIATDALGQKSVASCVTVTVTNGDTSAPTQPGNFRTTGVTYNKVSLAWDASTDNKAVTGYNLYLNGSSTPFTTVTTTTYDDTTVSPNSSYLYQVEAVDAAGNKSSKTSLNVNTPTAPDTQAPTTPTGFSALPSGSQVALKWNASTDNVAVQDYLVRKDGTVIATVTGTTYNDPSVASGQTYRYAIIARDTSNNSSAATSEVSVTMPVENPGDTQAPTVPTGVTATSPTSTQVNVSWDASSDNVAVTGYHVYRNGSTTPIATVSGNSFGDATVSAGQTYKYTVSAFDAAKNESAKSAAATVTTASDNNQATFSDDFTSGSSYWAPVKGSWNVADAGGTHGNVYHQEADGDAWSTAGSTTWGDYTVSADVQPASFITGTASSQFAALYGRWQDDTHWYYVVLRSNGNLELKKNNGSVYTVLASKQMTVTPGTWYNLKLTMQGANLNVSVNGQNQLNATDSTISTGKIGVGTYYAKANFDNVKVTQSSAPVVTGYRLSADSFILKQYPNTNYGGHGNMRADSDPATESVLKFTIGDLNGRTVTNAVLGLWVNNSSVNGGNLYSIPNGWTESGVTWNNAPQIPAGAKPVASLGAVTKGQWVTIDLTSLIRANGTYSLRLNTPSNDVSYYASRENKYNPQPIIFVTSQSAL